MGRCDAVERRSGKEGSGNEGKRGKRAKRVGMLPRLDSGYMFAVGKKAWK